jgi:hypothetical protein
MGLVKVHRENQVFAVIEHNFLLPILLQNHFPTAAEDEMTASEERTPVACC